MFVTVLFSCLLLVQVPYSGAKVSYILLINVKKYKDIEVNDNCLKTRWSLPCLGKVGTTARPYKRTQKDLKTRNGQIT